MFRALVGFRPAIESRVLWRLSNFNFFFCHCPSNFCNVVEMNKKKFAIKKKRKKGTISPHVAGGEP